MQIKLSEAIKTCNATLIYNHAYDTLSFDGAASDNRLVKENNLFVCIKCSIDIC